MSVEITSDSLTANIASIDKSKEGSLSELFEKSARKRNKKQNMSNARIKTKITNQVNTERRKKVSRNTTKTDKAIEAEKQKWLFDPWVIIIAITIIALGITMVGSASISIAERNNSEPFYYLYRQLIAAAIGVCLSA
ncbi:MAG: hypothetical protein KAI17_07640, partial [Thiotrichaceae bacterium]|nr:hypothetical protein [Thiotrichaceae bacterium]